MTYSEYIPFQQNAQQAWGHGGQFGQGGQGWGHQGGLGQAAFGGQGYGGSGGWQQNYGGAPWQQRGLSPHEVGEIVRHLAPLLPMIVNQAQQPHAAFGQQNYGGGFGGGWQQGYGGGFGGFGQGQRYLSQHDVGEVVRQILPALPQIVSMLQGQQQQGPFGQYGNAMYGGGQHFGGLGSLGQAAYGNMGNAWGGAQRQFGQGDIGEVVRQLSAVLPQVISNLQAFNQQQQRAG